MRGVCRTRDECLTSGGIADGNCAAGKKPKYEINYHSLILTELIRFRCVLHVCGHSLWVYNQPELYLHTGEELG